ncbi:efflux RND transporter periplasmic adaptor subunit [Halopseudomonas salegens]|uniref:RND family efflux transporter, MFP subunit n=1 Tax=Halopseudomonas salegens TaxID=1434072 RepID=A0A1H2F4K9_9GAMM|nr:efflux RND transporter periplasmic adaptor subunit [Halopseudomonas salegens]SDU02203.1 RND family efflux transporter, MFP subunit [Halopseudomonas salegens]
MRRALFSLLGLALLAGCGNESASQSNVDNPPKVRVVQLQPASPPEWTLSGNVQARHQVELGFRLAGEINQRRVQAGQRVDADDVLLTLDPRDVTQQLASARAALTAARLQAQNAESSRQRLQSLRERDLVPVQNYDDAVTAADAAQQSVRSAQAQLAQAETALEYVELRAPTDGVLIEVSGEVGQVVAPGQVVAVLASEGEHEVEVFVPERRRRGLPEQGQVVLFGGQQRAPASLREVAGAADPMTRSWRARFAIEDDPANWPLGSSVTLQLNGNGDERDGMQQLPLSALIDKGQGTGVWHVRDGKVEFVSVELVSTRKELAWIRSGLPAGTPVVALGVHLLEAGQAVEVLP